jgi:hypothetical protein
LILLSTTGVTRFRQYLVELSFVEHDHSGASSRVFNVYVGSVRVIDRLDIFSRVGANHAYRVDLGATADSTGVIAIRFTSAEPGCTGKATVSTIKVFDGTGDVVEIDASDSRHRMHPPVRHYNTGSQDTMEAILGRLGSRISLNLLPQRLACRFTSLGTWTGDLSEMVVGLRSGNTVRALPLTDRFPAWESMSQELSMTSCSFDCASGALPLELHATFRAPFYPGFEKLSTAPFFYIDLTVTNTGESAASCEVLLARPHKEGFDSSAVEEFSGGPAAGLTCRTGYGYGEETLSGPGVTPAVEASATTRSPPAAGSRYLSGKRRAKRSCRRGSAQSGRWWWNARCTGTAGATGIAPSGRLRQTPNGIWPRVTAKMASRPGYWS